MLKNFFILSIMSLFLFACTNNYSAAHRHGSVRPCDSHKVCNHCDPHHKGHCDHNTCHPCDAHKGHHHAHPVKAGHAPVKHAHDHAQAKPAHSK